MFFFFFFFFKYFNIIKGAACACRWCEFAVENVDEKFQLFNESNGNSNQTTMTKEIKEYDSPLLAVQNTSTYNNIAFSNCNDTTENHAMSLLVNN